MRRIAFLTAVAVIAFAGIAWAVTNQMTYTVKITKGSSKKASKKAPVPVGYNADLEVTTNPPGQQPDIAPITTVYLWKGLQQNAAKFPSCTQAQIDGQSTFPSACNKAVIGTGTATAYAGSPGGDISQSVKEDLTVKGVNGPKGTQLLLVVNSAPGAPVQISNRVVPGTLKGGKGNFGYSVEFDIPDDLQQQLGLSIALASFKLNIQPKTISVKLRGQKKKLSYLMMTTSCPSGGMPVEAITQFKDANGNITPVTSDSVAKC